MVSRASEKLARFIRKSESLTNKENSRKLEIDKVFDEIFGMLEIIRKDIIKLEDLTE